jgi:DNA-binding LytR/AlgR family response regulator
MDQAPDIVVIAKEARTRAELESLLGALGYDLEVFDDYPSIESFLPVSQSADLLFIEVSPDTIDQVEVLVKSASQYRKIPVVFLTNNKEETFFSRIKESRPFGFLPKPLDLGSIRRVVELALLYESSPSNGNGNGNGHAYSNGSASANGNGRAYVASNGELRGADTDFADGDDAFGTASFERWVGNNSAPLKYFFTKVGNKLKKVSLDDVLYVEVEGKYSSVHLKEKRYNVKASLKELMDKFPDDRFVRVSRNFIVNLDAVDYIDTVQYVIRLADRDIPVSRTYKEELMNRIRLL